jgi:hypothetical protein
MPVELRMRGLLQVVERRSGRRLRFWLVASDSARASCEVLATKTGGRDASEFFTSGSLSARTPPPSSVLFLLYAQVSTEYLQKLETFDFDALPVFQGAPPLLLSLPVYLARRASPRPLDDETILMEAGRQGVPQ